MYSDLIPSKFVNKKFKANCKKCGDEVERIQKNKNGYKCDKCRDDEVRENAKKKA